MLRLLTSLFLCGALDPVMAAEPAAPAWLPPPGPQVSDEQHDLDFFESEIRPLLARECFECHGPAASKARGGLRMAGRQALIDGGDSGPAIVPGAPDASLLIAAVRYVDPDLEMPPRNALSEKEVALLARWVSLGAPWPESGAGVGSDVDVEAGRRWWAFRPVEAVRVPDVGVTSVGATEFVRNPIDAFVLARLQAAGLKPAPPASPRELVRRATLDLTGLPPEFEEVESFASASGDAEWRALIERLLARPEYGERWGRHWLDVVRFAQTNGYEKDREKPFAWRYRDYVIDAFNADTPYDRFLREQLAGDELDEVTDASRIATGFYRLGVWDSEPDDNAVAALDERDDVVRTVSAGLLGVTLGCARCHDHKYDPFGQQDYDALAAFVGRVSRYEEPRFALDSKGLVPLDFTPEASTRWERDRARAIAELERERQEVVRDVTRRQVPLALGAESPEVLAAFRLPEGRRTPEQVAMLKIALNESAEITRLIKQMDRSTFNFDQQIERVRASFAGDLDWALTVSEDAEAPAGPVPPRFVRVLCPSDDASEPAAARPVVGGGGAGTAGLRRELAEWIVDPEHPLTARVFVNRVWQHHFGRGLVATPNDFGVRGARPSHPELLDWLAHQFVAGGWSVKDLHRLIMDSSTYRMSSRVAAGDASIIDPDNALLWRQNRRRLEAEAIRDSMLVVSGTLDPARGGRGSFAHLGRDALAGSSRPGEGWEISDERERSRRSIYLYAKRNLPVPLMEVFDKADPSLPVARRSTTTVPTQALTLLNGAFVNRMAAALRRRLEAETHADAGEDTITRAYELTLARRPTPAEGELAAAYLREETEAFAALHPLLVFEQAVPRRLQTDFAGRVQGPDVLVDPGPPWRAVKGEWSGAYNNTLAATPLREPASLLPAPLFDDVDLRTRVLLREGSDFGAVLLRAAIEGDVLVGLEVRLDPDAGRIDLIRQDASAAVPLASADVPVEWERWHDLRILLRGTRARVWFDGAGEPCLDHEDPLLPGRGALGVRTWGEAFLLDGLALEVNRQRVPVSPEGVGTPAQRALESLCLSLLNLNEFVYVD